MARQGEARRGKGAMHTTRKNIMTKANLFIGGVPTEPEVRKLIEAHPTLESGTTILHSDIEPIIGADSRSSRYRSVIAAWRARLRRERNIDTAAVAGVGIKVLGEYEKVEESMKDYRRGTRAVGKAVKRAGAARTENMTPDQQRVTDHARRAMEATLSEARRANKEMAIQFAPQQALPRVKIVK